MVKGETMEPEIFLLEMSELEECKKVMYKRMSIHMYIGLYYSREKGIEEIDSWMIPFGLLVKKELEHGKIDLDRLLKYMIENDESNFALYAATTKFDKKAELSFDEYLSFVARDKVLTPYVDKVNIDTVALIVLCFVFDNLSPKRMDISQIVQEEIFEYHTNQYGLTKVNGATFKQDGLIFSGKAYYYNYFTNKAILHPMDSMPGFAKIIQEEAGECDVLFRLDERLALPEPEYYDYTGVAFAKFYGPYFSFNAKDLKGLKTIIVHIDSETSDKLLMVIKRCVEKDSKQEFWHIEIETLPNVNNNKDNVITTFLHGMYFPQKDRFTHIDYAKNQYNGDEYSQKYQNSQDGMPIDQYTSSRDLHYKIWCIENGEFTRETWYKLMIISLSKKYQSLLNEMLQFIED